MTRPRIGTVEYISGFVSGDGQQLITIDGKTFAASINFERYPVRPGSQVEFRTEGNRAEILAVQAELIPVPQAQNLFSNCTACIGCAGDCTCLTKGLF
jgi:hypothetical protein